MGVRSIGPYITFLGGLITAITLTISALIGWVMAYPGVAQDGAVLKTLYYMGFALGGVGYSVPMGLLIAGVSVSAGFAKLLPKWLIWFGIIVAIFGETSCLTLIFPGALPLIPLTRFPGFVWLIFAGFKLPKLALNKSDN